MEVRPIPYIETGGYIRIHGLAYGRRQYELCFDKNNPAMEIVREALLNDRLLFLEIAPESPESEGIPILRRPYRTDRNEVCVLLPLRYNDVWERLYMMYQLKPIPVRVFLKTEGGDPP